MSALPSSTASGHASRVRLRAGLATAVAAVLGLLVLASPAGAHDEIVSQAPEENAVMATMPAEVVIEMSEPPQAEFVEVQVRAADGSPIGGEPAVQGTRVSVPLDAGAADGRYQVAYRIVSSDGHPVTGTWAFGVGEAGAVPGPLEDAAAEDDASTSTTAFLLAGAALLAFLAVFGLVAWRAAARRRVS